MPVNATLKIVFKNGVVLDIDGDAVSINKIMGEFYSDPEKAQPDSQDTGNGSQGHLNWRASEVAAMVLVPN